MQNNIIILKQKLVIIYIIKLQKVQKYFKNSLLLLILLKRLNNYLILWLICMQYKNFHLFV